MKENKTKRVLMVVFSYYPADPRPRREAEALIQNGYLVDLICLKNDSEPANQIHNGVTIHRLPLRKKRSSKLRYLFEYSAFLLLAFVKLSLLYFQKRYNFIHIHNMPDILVFSAILPKFNRKTIILDLHDPMPEVFMAKYNYNYNNLIIRLLILMERFSIVFCDLVITPNTAFKNKFVSRGCPADKIHIIMNSPQESIFLYSNSEVSDAEVLPKIQRPLKLMFHGTIVERHGLDLALQSIQILKTTLPGIQFNVFGEGDFVPQFLKLVKDLQISNHVVYYGHVPLEQIAEAIKEIDIGIIPNRRSAFTEINMPTRIFEYLAMRKPVVVPRTQGIQDYFDENAMFYFDPDDFEDLTETIYACSTDHKRRLSVLEKGLSIYNRYCWDNQKSRLLSLYSRLD